MLARSRAYLGLAAEEQRPRKSARTGYAVGGCRNSAICTAISWLI